jgi:hypothetical protein
MFVITNAADAEMPLDARVRRLLRLRRDQLAEHIEDAAQFLVADERDSLSDIEALIGFPITDEGEPCFEWIVDHGEGLFELVFILSDGDPAQVLLVAESQGWMLS